MGAIPTCSLDDPSACSCINDASAYVGTLNYTYCDDSSIFNANCCTQIGSNYGSMGYSYEYFSCYTPNPVSIANNASACPHPVIWQSQVALTCGPVFKFFKDVSGQNETSDHFFNPFSGNNGSFTTNNDTFCCGQYNVTCDQKNFVTEIKWSFKNDGKRKLIIPASIGGLNGLKDLSGNKFYSSIPETISNLTTLEYLNLSHNALTGPISGINFQAMKKLKMLDISYNKLGDSVPLSFGNVSTLTNLFIEYNRFSGNIPFSSSNFSISYEKYNMTKPNMTVILEKRLKSYSKHMDKARDVFDQVGIEKSEDIPMICPGSLFSRYLERLYISYLSSAQAAKIAIQTIQSYQGSRFTGNLVKKSLIAAFKLQILASSKYCRRRKPWGYNGINGPQRWFIEHPECSLPNQSPINIEPSNTAMFHVINNSDESHFKFLSSQYTGSQVDRSDPTKPFIYLVSRDNAIIIDNYTYYLARLDIHTPSEHRIQGRDYVAELQLYFVKSNDSSNYSDYYSSYPNYYSNYSNYFSNYSSYNGSYPAYYSNYSNYYGNYSQYFSNYSNYLGNYSDYYGNYSYNYGSYPYYSGNYSSSYNSYLGYYDSSYSFSYYSGYSSNYSDNNSSYFQDYYSFYANQFQNASNYYYNLSNSTAYYNMTYNYSSYYMEQANTYASMSNSYQQYANFYYYNASSASYPSFSNYNYSWSEPASDYAIYYKKFYEFYAIQALNASNYYNNVAKNISNSTSDISSGYASADYYYSLAKSYADTAASYNYMATYYFNYFFYYYEYSMSSYQGFSSSNNYSTQGSYYANYYKNYYEFQANQYGLASNYYMAAGIKLSNYSGYYNSSNYYNVPASSSANNTMAGNATFYRQYYSPSYYFDLASLYAGYSISFHSYADYYYNYYSNNYTNYYNNYGYNNYTYYNSPNEAGNNGYMSDSFLPGNDPYSVGCIWNGMDFVGNCKFRFGQYEPMVSEENLEIVAIGAFIQLADESSDVISSIATAYSSQNVSNSAINLNYTSIFSQLQKSEVFYPYKGSFTQPPCISDVNWLISTKNVFNISLDDLKMIETVQGFNSRDTQPLGDERASDLF